MTLSWLSLWQAIILARAMEIDFLTRISWMRFLTGLLILGFISLLAWTLTWSRYRERILFWTEFPERAVKRIRWFGWNTLFISLVGYTVVFAVPFIPKPYGWPTIFQKLLSTC